MPNIPSNIESEEIILASIFVDQAEIVTAIATLKDSDFYDQKNRYIFKAFCELDTKGISIDVNTTYAQLGKIYIDAHKKNPEVLATTIVSLEYLEELFIKVVSSAGIKHAIELVKEASIKREIIEAADEIKKAALNKPDLSAEEVLHEADELVQKVTRPGGEDKFASLTEALVKLKERLDYMKSTKQERVNTGFTDLDNDLNGFNPGELIILAARTGVGKTAFALNIAKNVASHSNKNVLIFSLEMSNDEIAARFASMLAQIYNTAFRNNKIADDYYEKFLNLINGESKEFGIFIDSSPAVSINDIRARCISAQRKRGKVDFVIIDYLQLIKSDSASKNKQRNEEVAQFSRSLKQLAKELQVPILAIAQLNRDAGADIKTKKTLEPVLKNLAESGAIEQDADMVLFLYKSEVTSAVETKDDTGKSTYTEDIYLKIAKNRHGSSNIKYKFSFNGSFFDFVSQGKVNDIE